MSLMVQIVFNLIEYWILILMMQYVCAAHMELNKRNALIGSGIAVLGTAASVFIGGPLAFILGMAAEIALTVLLFSRKRFSDLLRFFPACGIFFFLEVVPEALMQELVSETQIQINFQGTTLNLISLITDVTLFVLLLVLRHVEIKYRVAVHFSAREILGSIALVFFSLIDGAFIVMLNRAQYEPVWYFIFVFIFVGGYLLGVGYYLYSLIESRIRISRQTKARCETEYLRLQLDALRDSKENEEHVRKMRHDLNNHLAVLSSLCEEGNYEEVLKYTKQLEQRNAMSGIRIFTGNQIADLVVASKRRLCDSHEIEFDFSGSLENLRMMDAPDICGLLANAYDNAIEACMGQDKAYIRTKVNTTRNYTVIEIVNSTKGKVPVRGNSVATTKKDRKSHGYGIEIMKQIAGRYHGDCSIHCDGKEFAVKIVLLTKAENLGYT